MIYTEETKKAMRFAYKAHKDQTDRGGIPYVFHPFTVASSMKDETSTIIALLHDVVEDTDYTFEDLKKEGFSDQVIDNLKLLTKETGEDYFNYINRISASPIAIQVKLADIKHNSQKSRLSTLNHKDIERLKKYNKAKRYLKEQLIDK